MSIPPAAGDEFHDDNHCQPLLKESLIRDGDKVVHSRLKVASLVCGSLIAPLSQLVLAQALWSDEVLQRSNARIAFFAFIWSLATCSTVYLGMAIFLWVNRRNKAISDDEAFHLETHHIVGSLSSLILVWILHDVVSLKSHFMASPSHRRMIVVTLFSFYVLFLFWFLTSIQREALRNTRKRGETSLEPTKKKQLQRTLQLIASIAGLLVGTCTQLLLVCFLQDTDTREPIVSNTLFLAAIWGSISMVSAAVGGALLSGLIVPEEFKYRGQYERALWKMEISYTVAVLVGIAAAWIMIDLFYGAMDKMATNLGLLVLSLLAFLALIKCFPVQTTEDNIEEQEITVLNKC